MNINSKLILVDKDYDDYRTFTKQEKRQRRKERRRTNQSQKDIELFLNLKCIEPKTKNQAKTFVEYKKDKHLLLYGMAGTGKTFISSYLAINEILRGDTNKQKLIIIRSIVPTRDIGFLPGNQKEKQRAYELPYYNIFNELFERNNNNAYDYLKNKGVVDFLSTSFIRGITLNNCILIVDECQNMTFHELDSVITRVGDNCKIILCGDFRQSDLIKDKDREGLLNFMKVLQNLKYFKFVSFDEDDIVRSELVKDYIIAKLEQGIYI